MIDRSNMIVDDVADHVRVLFLPVYHEVDIVHQQVLFHDFQNPPPSSEFFHHGVFWFRIFFYLNPYRSLLPKTWLNSCSKLLALMVLSLFFGVLFCLLLSLWYFLHPQLVVHHHDDDPYEIFCLNWVCGHRCQWSFIWWLIYHVLFNTGYDSY